MLWLCISSDYLHINVAICNETNIVHQQSIDKKNGNQQLLLTIDSLLEKAQSTLCDLAYIGVNLGPGPYTSLRIAIATANGLHAATGIPLIGIDALKAFIHDYLPKEHDSVTIALLNAFNFDLFYAIGQCDQPPIISYKNVDLLFDDIQKDFPNQHLLFIGNGAELYAEKINEAFGDQATIARPLPTYASMQQLVHLGWQHWQDKNTIETALPLYLKKASYHVSIKAK